MLADDLGDHGHGILIQTHSIRVRDPARQYERIILFDRCLLTPAHPGDVHPFMLLIRSCFGFHIEQKSLRNPEGFWKDRITLAR